VIWPHNWLSQLGFRQCVHKRLADAQLRFQQKRLRGGQGLLDLVLDLHHGTISCYRA
jgi:hypothetical protein